jgi:tRNA pseudouridine55 synthase
MADPARHDKVKSMAEALARVLPTRPLTADQARDVTYGRPLDVTLDGPTLLLDAAGLALAVYAPQSGRATPQTVLVGGGKPLP